MIQVQPNKKSNNNNTKFRREKEHSKFIKIIQTCSHNLPSALVWYFLSFSGLVFVYSKFFATKNHRNKTRAAVAVLSGLTAFPSKYKVNEVRMRLKLFFDGACKPNPGDGGYGFVIIEDQDVIYSDNGRLSTVSTSNTAEYMALIHGLRYVLRQFGESVELEIFGDSQLVIEQLKNERAVENPLLRTVYQVASSIIEKFQYVTLTHVPREQNVLADRLAYDGLERFKEDEFIVYYPSLVGTYVVKFGNNYVRCSNDFGTALMQPRHTIIAYNFFRAILQCDISDLSDPHPHTVCVGKVTYDIVGVVNKSVVCQVFPTDSGINGPFNTLDVKNAFVVRNFPVPIHVAVHQMVGNAGKSMMGSGDFAAGSFPEVYRSNPFWTANSVFLPY
jgi:ribonuclease HI